MKRLFFFLAFCFTQALVIPDTATGASDSAGTAFRKLGITDGLP